MPEFHGCCGEMSATSIVDCGFVFPIFTPFAYQYFSTGTLEKHPTPSTVRWHYKL